MTLGQQAVQQASQQAEKIALENTALRMLKEKLDIKLIAKVTKLSLAEIRKLEKNTN